MRLIRDEEELDIWDKQEILAMFCSNVDKHRSFSKYFRETRGRLIQNVCDTVNGDVNKVQIAYTLACMEYERIGSHFDPRRPTQHMVRFVELFQKNPKKYTILNNKANKRLRYDLTVHLARVRDSSAWSTVSQEAKDYLHFLWPGGKEQLLKAADKKIKRKRGKRGKKGNKKVDAHAAKYARYQDQDYDEDESDDDQAALWQPEGETYAFKGATLDVLRKHNVYILSLLHSMPGLVEVDTEIHMTWIEGMEDFTPMREELACIDDDPYNSKGLHDKGTFFVGSVDGEVDDAKFAKFMDAVDIDKLLQKRDGLEGDDEIVDEFAEEVEADSDVQDDVEVAGEGDADILFFDD